MIVISIMISLKIDNELCLLLTNIAKSGDFVVSNVLGTGSSATEIAIKSS